VAARRWDFAGAVVIPRRAYNPDTSTLPEKIPIDPVMVTGVAKIGTPAAR